MNFGTILKRIDRIVVWALLILFLVFVISGYMITRGFIDRYYGLLLHRELDLPIMLLFVIHVTVNMRSILTRWGLRSRKSNLLSLTMGSCLFLFIFYLDQFFELMG